MRHLPYPTLTEIPIVADELRPFLPAANDLTTSGQPVILPSPSTGWNDDVKSGTGIMEPISEANTSFSSDTDGLSPPTTLGASPVSRTYPPGQLYILCIPFI